MILAALDGLERGTDPSAPASRGDETAETLARLYTEVLGLIPYELAPTAPSADAKQRLMAALTGVQPEPLTPVPSPIPSPPPGEGRPLPPEENPPFPRLSFPPSPGGGEGLPE